MKMSDLRATFERAGGYNVRTFIQSGNVLFEASTRDAVGIVRKVGARLRRTLGTEPEIIVRNVHHIEALVEAAPFKDFQFRRGIKLYVAFLSRRPTFRPALPLISTTEALEIIRVSGHEAFIVSRPKKRGFFGFPNNFIEEQLGVSATSRNWSTVTKIADLAQNQADG